MLKPLSSGDPIFEAPGLYNAYPIANEVSTGISPNMDLFDSIKESSNLYIDDLYGRVYCEALLNTTCVYGKTSLLDYYSKMDGLKVIDELRVPFRKVPIYAVDQASDIEPFVDALSKQNSSHKILLRGQAKTYLIERPKREFETLYGELVNEPSFLPSHLRANFDEYTLKSLWHSLSSILLHEACIDEASSNSKNSQELLFDAYKVRHTLLFDLFALGIAQHYGLPSVGLDLTDDISIASWFALNRVIIDSNGCAASYPVGDTDIPTIFAFRCPLDAVFDYKLVRPKILGPGRPDSQCAWFGHVGWGEAKNQLGSYLMCGFRLRPENFEDLPKDYWRQLFPDTRDDYTLNFFNNMKNRTCYDGEAKRALDRLYLFKH